MEREKGKSRKRVRRPLGLMNFLQREGRRCCAFMLCFTMIVGNTASLAVAAVSNDDRFLFQLDRASLYEAIQEAILRNQVAAEDMKFEGDQADDYQMLLGEMSNDQGELYELKPELTDETEQELSLRIFTRLDGEIPLMDEERIEEYEITGNEQFIFVLTNHTSEKQTAEIQVDDRRTEVITVLPRQSVHVETEAADEAAGTGTAEKTGSGSSGGNTTGNTIGGKTEEIGTTEESKIDEESADADVTDEESVSEAEEPKTEASEPEDEELPEEKEMVSEEDETDQEDSVEDADSRPETAEIEESSEKEESSEEEDNAVDSASAEETEADTEAEKETEAKAEETETEGVADTEKDTDSSEDVEAADDTDVEEAVEDVEATDDTDAKEAVEVTEDTGDAEVTENAEDTGDTEAAAQEYSLGISRNEVSRVAFSLKVSKPSEATSSNADKAEDEENEKATPSDAEIEVLEGTKLDTVLMNDEAVAVFVTTAADMGLDEDFLNEEEPEKLPEVILPEKKVPEFQTYTKVLDNVTVEVTAETGVLPDPENVELRVEELTEDGDLSDQYQEAAEALEKAGTEYTGMMAFDISFWQDGSEIEPDGKVQVSMRLNPEKIPEEADTESLMVQHLAEKEDGISVEAVADCGDETAGSIEVKESEHVAAEFEVESFSTFTITWTSNSGKVTVYMEYWTYDSITKERTRIEVPFAKEITINETKEIVWKEIFGELIPGYKLEYIKIATDGQGEAWQSYENTYKILVEKNETGNIVLYNYESSQDTGGKVYTDKIKNGNLYVGFYYNKNSDVGQITLIDEIAEKGCFTVDTTTIPNINLQGEETIEYRWYKVKESDNINEWQWNGPIETKTISGDNDNIFNGGKSINVALDTGVADLKAGLRYCYKVKAVKISGDKEEVIGESAGYLVKYYGQLQNGSFEKPKVSESGARYNQFPNGTEGLVWQTTGVDENGNKAVEITLQNNEYHGDVKSVEPMDGTQYAELNAEAAGALYQDVLTVPGATLYWNLYHRARVLKEVNGVTVGDIMYVLIMPTDKAQEINNQEDVEAVIAALEAGSKDYEGAYVERIQTDTNSEWKPYDGQYPVPNGQYLTRFFFVAGATGSNDVTMGNFLDDVSFSMTIPKPSEGKGSLLITKTVPGLLDKDAKNYKIDLTVKGPGVNETVSLAISENEDGTYSATRLYYNIPVGNYTISERVPDDVQETLTGYENGYKATIKVGNNTITNGTVSVSKGNTTEVDISNEYTKKEFTFTVKKEVTGNMGDKNKSFDFGYQVDDGDLERIELKHGDFKTISVPYGAKVKVVELGSGDYTTSVTQNGILYEDLEVIEQNGIVQKIYELEEMTDNTEIIFINDKSIATPTGIHTSKLPHLLMMAMAALSMAGMAFTSACAKAHKKDED